MSSRSWLESRTTGAPEALRDIVLRYAVDAESWTAEGLAEASRTALRDSLSRDPGREAALELLCADALITLALLARAEEEPEELDRFAAALANGEIALG